MNELAEHNDSALQLRWNSERLDALLGGISALRPLARSGFPQFDEMLNGGYCAGTHLLSAVPGCGKSTFCAQIGDTIARFGSRKVLYCSIEMSASALVLKSICRLSCELSEQPLSFAEVLQLSKRLANKDEPRVSLLLDTIALYRDTIAPNVATLDSGITLDSLQSLLESISKTDSAPCLIIDYLQLMKGNGDDQTTDYQAITALMRRLCVLARDFRTPIIAISSQNRSARRGTSDFAALSGSGELEYGSSSIAFLSTDEPEKPFVRNIKLSLSKNRFGRTGNIDLQMYPAQARFVEVERP